jgi:hypothetical protein
MDITGRIIQKLQLQEGTSSRGGWKKQEFIIETNEKFPKKVCITAWSEKVDELQKFNINDDVKLSVNVESREFNGRWYTDLKFWKIEAASSASSVPSNESNQTSAPVYENSGEFGNENISDDLPF